MSLLLWAAGVFVAGRDVIVQKSCCFRSCVSNQGFLFREFKLEFFPQERFDARLDFLSLRFWPDKPKYPVVRVSTVPQSPVVGIIRVLRWELLCNLSHLARFFVSPGPFEFGYLTHECGIWRIIWAPDPFGVLWNECVLDELVQFVKVDIAEYRAANAA